MKNDLIEIPQDFPSLPYIFSLLARGEFKPMEKSFRDGAAGAGPLARTYETQSGLIIIADCQDGEGLHFEIWQENGNVWGIDATSGELDLLINMEEAN